MFQMPYGYQDGKGGPGELRPPSRPPGEDPPLPSRRVSGPAPMRAGTDCVWRAERLRLTADRSRAVYVHLDVTS